MKFLSSPVCLVLSIKFIYKRGAAIFSVTAPRLIGFIYRQRPLEKIRRIRIALICGGILRVITPLNQMAILSPIQNRLAVLVRTITFCPVARSLTSKLPARTSRTIASISISVAPPIVTCGTIQYMLCRIGCVRRTKNEVLEG